MHLDSRRVQELVVWTPPPGSPRTDGVPPTSYPARAEHTDPDFPGRDFAHGRGWGIPPLSSAVWPRTAGAVGVMTTADDRPADWVSAGQALQRILLTAGTCGVAAALHSQPIELPWLRDRIRGTLGGGGYPQLLVRLGTVTQTEVSVRRAPDEVVGSSHASQRPPSLSHRNDVTAAAKSPGILPEEQVSDPGKGRQLSVINAAGQQPDVAGVHDRRLSHEERAGQVNGDDHVPVVVWTWHSSLAF
jgi:hypothetical protein